MNGSENNAFAAKRHLQDIFYLKVPMAIALNTKRPAISSKP